MSKIRIVLLVSAVVVAGMVRSSQSRSVPPVQKPREGAHYRAATSGSQPGAPAGSVSVSTSSSQTWHFGSDVYHTPRVEPVIVTPPPYGGVLFDAHCHGSYTDLSETAAVLSILQGNRVEGAILFLSTPNTKPVALDPMARLFTPLPTDPAQMDSSTINMLESKLKSGVFHGIGEIPFRHDNPSSDYPADGPYALSVYDLAATYDVPVTVHVNSAYYAELDRGCDHNPDARIIWAHAGDADACLVRDMLSRNPNLYVDLSCRHPYFPRGHPLSEQSIMEGETLKSDWKKLFEDCSDRFMIGTDVGGPNNSARIGLLSDVLGFYRTMLGQLDPAVASKIAFENGHRVCGF